MDTVYDVAIIGGGPSGSYAASLLAGAGHRVLVLEGKRADGVEPTCTGVVGVPYVQLVGVDRDVILASASSVKLISPSGATLHVIAPQVQAYVLDRTELERRLRGRAVGMGADWVEGLRVSRVGRRGSNWELRGYRTGTVETYFCRALIVAAGVSPGLVRQLGIAAPPTYMVGAHAVADMDGVHETEVHLLPHLGPGAFGWLVPVSGRRVRVGMLSTRSAAQCAKQFLGTPTVRSRIVKMPDLVLQRPVPVSTCTKTYVPGAVVIGDAAGQVKPTTGGGLYFGACGARAAAEVVDLALKTGDLSSSAMSGYQQRWQSAFGRELRRGALTRGIYARLSPAQVDRIIARAERMGLGRELVNSDSFSFDNHGRTLLTGLLRCLPGFGHGVAVRDGDE